MGKQVSCYNSFFLCCSKSLTEKVLITGASNGGLGSETAISLASGRPAQLVLLARSAAKVDPVISRIHEIDPHIKVTFVAIELDDLDSVREAAAKVNADIDKLDILICNAGIMAIKDFTINKHGVEIQFATNHIGHFLLTKLLYSKIQAAGSGARIINVTSDGHEIGPCRFEDFNFKVSGLKVSELVLKNSFNSICRTARTTMDGQRMAHRRRPIFS